MATKRSSDRASARRIFGEIIPDANGSDEQAMGWYYYLADRLQFPFAARCRTRRAISPLRVDDRVIVSEMAPEADCSHEMFVQIRWANRLMGVPLAQLELLEPRKVSDGTREAIADWHYWVARGYEL